MTSDVFATNMPGIDEAMEPDDFDDATLMLLGDRIARSRCYEDFVYREVELDEVLRMLDFAHRDARSRGAAALSQDLAGLKARVLEAHRVIAGNPILPMQAVLALDPGRTERPADALSFN